MGSSNAVGVLGSLGWLNDPFKKADQLLSYFIVAEYSQDPFFKVEASLPWLLQRYEGQPTELARNTQTVLQNYFEAHYSAVRVEVTALKTPGNDNDTQLKIELDLRDDNNRTVSLGKLATYEGSKLLKIAALNNGTLPTTA